MKKPLILLSMMAALASGQAFAQDNTENADQAPEAEATQDAPATETDTQAVGGDLDLGQSEEPAQPRAYIRETFGDWGLQCIAVSPGSEEEMCQMYQLLADDSGASVAEANIFKLSNAGQAVAGGNIVVPLETLLTEGMRIQIDSSAPRKYEFSFCNQVGCFARVGFTQADVDAFKRGAVAKVSIVPALAPDQRVTVNMSLKGFTAAYDQATVIQR
ncbi:MAG: invasion associated locus B family protein [Pelagimonas sp.]|jgi:invasion protein IalB|nr:invasion associated locus B family protein [Pelagimonas sp.]